MSSGRELCGVSVKIVDNEGNEMPPNRDGEIVVKGSIVLAGYWKNEEAYKNSFTKNGYFKFFFFLFFLF